MNIKKTNGDIAEKKAQAFLEKTGFKILEIDNGECLPYDIYAEKNNIKYFINVKSAKAKGGLFGIQTSNMRLLYAWSLSSGAIPAYLFVFDVNFIFFEMNGSFSQVSENAKFWAAPNRRHYTEDNPPSLEEAEKLADDLQKQPTNPKLKEKDQIYLRRLKDSEKKEKD